MQSWTSDCGGELRTAADHAPRIRPHPMKNTTPSEADHNRERDHAPKKETTPSEALLAKNSPRVSWSRSLLSVHPFPESTCVLEPFPRAQSFPSPDKQSSVCKFYSPAGPNTVDRGRREKTVHVRSKVRSKVNTVHQLHSDEDTEEFKREDVWSLVI